MFDSILSDSHVGEQDQETFGSVTSGTLACVISDHESAFPKTIHCFLHLMCNAHAENVSVMYHSVKVVLPNIQNC